MKTLKDYIDNDMLSWLRDNGLSYKLAKVKVDKGELNILHCDKYCVKFYDRMGHGFGVTASVTDKYDESIYDNDNFSLTWVFEYLEIKETASFNNRKADEYQDRLPNLISDIKTITPRLTQMTTSEWSSMTEWIKKEAKKRFG